MTDTTAETDLPEVDAAPIEDTSADDARYAAMAEKYGEKSTEAPTDPTEQPESKEAPKREPLPPEELEKRWKTSATALKEARQRQRELEEQLEKARATTQPDTDELLELIGALRDDDEDPIEDIAGLKKALKLFKSRQEAEREQERTQTQQQTAMQRFRTSVAEAEAEFREDAPDYDDAQAYFKESLKAELTDLGLEGDELSAEFHRQVMSVAQQALQRGKNPAQVVYEIAKRRGYKAQEKAQVATQQERPQVKSETIDTAREVIDKLSKTQAASKSLSNVSGGGPGGKEVTLASVAKMSGKDLLQGYKALKEQAKRTGTYR